MAQNSPVNPAEGSKDLAQQLQELQAQVSLLEKKASIITPDIEELIELYRDTERYRDKCFQYVERSTYRLLRYCKEDVEDVVYKSYEEHYGKIIAQMEDCLVKDITAQLIESISIDNFPVKV